MCERWHTFENFLSDMGERPKGSTIDRIDSSMGYEPGNCRWATLEQQSRNRKTWVTLSDDVVREIHRRCGAGETVAAVARSIGVAEGTVRHARKGETWKELR